MERESMEALTTRSPLIEENPDINGIDHSLKSGGADTGFSSITPTLFLSIFVASVGTFAFGCATGYSSPAESGIMNDLALSTAEYSVFGSIMTIGGILGAIVSGKVADLIGRRGAMWFLEVFNITGWLAIIFAEGAWLLDIGRLTLGFGIGIHGYVIPVYIAEITPKNIRGGCTAANMVMVCFAGSLMFLVGNFVNWRTLAVIGALPCLVQVVGLFFIPESPRWLAKIGREKEFEANLQRLRGKYADISQEVTEIKDYTEMLQQPSETKFVDMFNRKYASFTHYWSWAHVTGNNLEGPVGFNIMQVQFSMLLAARLELGLQQWLLFRFLTLFKCNLSMKFWLMNFSYNVDVVLQIPFSALSVFLPDKFGRRPVLLFTAAGACLGTFVAGLAFLLQDLHQQKEVTAIMVLSGILVYSSCFSIGMSGIPWIIMSEILPINIKGSAGSLVNLANWFGSWIVTYAFNFLFEWSSAGVFFIFASICSSIVVFVTKLVPETKGRTLEEIQGSMIHLSQGDAV
ncbi:hypothetical protein F0562_019849 [Nyssa sinensis]|uniref:Major facilitator superfamily (MFS) profile domain-containing protein n=1 Tax=Nyssa sinensis TaxID=561372 RepID=A0A5J5BTI9_9ASTE|nr:hypothetical protein F0562_019849 [Nyssa sinensis]